VLVPDALVFNTANPGLQSSDGATELVSLELSDSVAPAVSTAAAAGQVSLVLVPSTDTIGPSSASADTQAAGSAPSGRRAAPDEVPSSRRHQSSPTRSSGSATHGGSK
jgi:Flp pilus assembly protein CpaB